MTLPATRVPAMRGTPPSSAVKVGAPVRAADWLEAAKLVQWLRGHGRVLVPQGRSKVALDGTTTSRVFRYKVKPTGRAIVRVWVFDVRCTGAFPSYASFTAQAGAGATSAPYIVNTRSLDATPLIYVETGCTKTTAESEISCTLTRSAGSLDVVSVGCWELPRAALTKDTTDYAIDLDSIYPRRPIFDADYLNATGLGAALYATDGRRGGLVGLGFSTARSTAAAFEDVFDAPIPIVPRQFTVGQTKTTVRWDVYAWVSVAGTTGEFRVVTSGGNSAVKTVNSTTPAWLGPGDSAEVRVEDLTTSNGVRTGTYDTIQLQVRRTAGANEVRFDTFVSWEGA